MRLPSKQKEFLYAEISKLLKAGIPIEKAAALILDQDPPAAQRTYLESLVESIDEGSSIAEATKAIPLEGISGLEKQIVEAGEQGGRLEHAYDHLGHYFSLINRTATTIRTQLIYPAILIHLAVILPALPKTFILKMFGEDTSHVIRNAFITLILLYILVALVWFAYRQLAAIAGTNEDVDKLLNKIPLTGKLRRFFGLARFAGVLRIYLLSGQRTAESVLGAGSASLAGSIHCASQRMGKKILQGSPLATEIKPETAFPKDFKRGIGTAESAGTLDDEAGRWEAIFLERAETSADRLAAWFPKVIYLLAVGLMAWQIISVFQTYIGGLTGMLDAMP